MTEKDNLKGIVWLIGAMGAYAIEDALFKTIMKSVPVGQSLILFSIGGAILFAGLIKSQSLPILQKELLSWPIFIRSLCEIFARLSYLVGLTLVPISTATIIIQSLPLMMLLGAVIFFKERIGLVRWMAVLIGLMGVLIVLNPKAEDVSLHALLIVVSVLGFAGRDLASRKASPHLSTIHLGFYGFLSIFIAGSCYALISDRKFVTLDLSMTMLFAAAIAIGVSGYFCLMKAMRTGEISIMMPFRYTRLLFGVSIGVLLFNEALSFNTLLGSAIIVASGLMIWAYEFWSTPKKLA